MHPVNFSLQSSQPHPVNASTPSAYALLTPPSDNVTFGKQAAKPAAVTWQKVANETYKSRFLGGNIETYQFSNGVKAILHKDKRLPITSMGIVIKAGAGEETSENFGGFHYLEHLLLVDDNRTGKTTNRDIANLGASINGFTGIDQTAYIIENIPKEHTKKAFSILANTITNPTFTKKEVDRERTIILNEARGGSDDISDRANEKLSELFYGKNHPYSNDVAGSHESIKNISHSALLNIHKQYYGPKNQVVVINGDFDTDTILSHIASNLGEQSAKATPRTVEKPFTPNPTIDELWVKRNDDITQFNAGSISLGPLRKDKDYKKDFAALNVLTKLVCDGKGSRAAIDIIEPKLAELITFFIASGHNQAAITTDFSCKPENYDTVLKKFNAILADIAENGITEKELKTVKTVIRTKDIKIPQCHESRFLHLLALANNTQLAHETPEEDYEIYKNLTTNDIKHVAKKYMLNRQGEKKLYIAPKAHTLPSGPNVAVHNDADLIKESFTHTSKTIQFSGKLSKHDHAKTLPNGMEVVTRSLPDSPIFAIDIQLPGGRTFANHLEQATDGLTQAKISTLNHLFSEGVGGFDDSKLFQFVKQHGITGTVNIGPNATHIYASAPTEQKDKLIELLTAVIQQGPVINTKKIASFSTDAKRLLELQQQNKAMLDHSMKLTDRFFPDETNPRGFKLYRLTKHIDKVTPENLANLWAQLLVTKGAVISFVGDTTPDDAAKIASNLFKPVPKSSIPSLKSPTRVAIAKNDTITAPNPNQQQVSLSKRWELPSRKAAPEDTAPLIVLKGLLNGLHGRLFEATRVERERGLLYSIGADMKIGAADGYFTIMASTEPDNAKPVLATIDAVRNEFANAPPKKEDMNRVINTLKVGQILANQRSTTVAKLLTAHRTNNTDSLEELLEKLEAVTPQQVQAVAKKYLTKPSHLTVSASEENLKKAGFEHHHSKDTATALPEGK